MTVRVCAVHCLSRSHFDGTRRAFAVEGTIFWADTDASKDAASCQKSAHKFSVDSSVSLQKMTSLVAGAAAIFFPNMKA